MAHLTVGYVSGIIALCVFILQFLGPNLLNVVLAAGLGRKHTASTWAVVGRELQSSLWPAVLRSDTAATENVDRRVLVIGWGKVAFAFLLAISGIVTPLGLFETYDISSDTTLVNFAYVKDYGPLGIGTQARSPENYFSRVCGGASDPDVPGGNFTGYVYCPETLEYLAHNTTLEPGPEDGPPVGSSDVRVPESIAKTFQSGTSSMATVSNFFDIEYRQLSQRTFNSPNFTFPIAGYQHLLTSIAEHKFQLAEGVIIDTINLGVGFRNHTLPNREEAPMGAEWTEDILFLRPITECVNMNLTLEFQSPDFGSFFANDLSGWVSNTISIVDQGGFVYYDQQNSNRETWFNKSQADPQLYDRAWLASQTFSRYLMALYNVSNGTFFNDTLQITSKIGQRFTTNLTFPPAFKPNSVSSSSQWGDWVPTGLELSNPFNLTYEDFYGIQRACTLRDYLHSEIPRNNNVGNIDNLGVVCGMFYGFPVKTELPPSVADYGGPPSYWWAAPMYSCASVTEVSVKTVHFRFAPELDPNPVKGLAYLQVLSIEDKQYTTPDEQPFWAVENLDSYNVSYAAGNSVWGLVSREYVDQQTWRYNTIQSPRLILSGNTEYNNIEGQNLPAADLLLVAFAHLYNLNPGLDPVDAIYAGLGDATVAEQWKQLSQNASSVPSIVNRIWVDFVTNGLVGSKGQLPKPKLPPNLYPPAQVNRNTEPQNTSPAQAQVAVFLVKHQIRYRWLFAIPALISTVIFICIIVWSLVSAIFSGVSPSVIKYYLHSISFGRLLTLQEFESVEDSRNVGSREWARRAGKIAFSIVPTAVEDSLEKRDASEGSDQDLSLNDAGDLMVARALMEQKRFSVSQGRPV